MQESRLKKSWVHRAFYLLLICVTLTITLCLSGCANFRPSWISENSYKVEDTKVDDIEGIEDLNGLLGGHFEGDEWVPDNPDIAMTYKIPDIGAGFILDISTMDVSPSIQIELLEFNSFIPYIRFIKIDFGVAYQRGYVYVGKLFTSIFEISAGGFVGWNFEDKEISYGVGATIIKF